MKQLVPAVNSEDHIKGNPEAVLELVEYGDYQCPYCGRAYRIVQQIERELGKDMKFVFRNFPLAKIHLQAKPAAVATEAAALQGRFWEMHDIIFENQQILSADNILLFAENIGLDTFQFENDIQRKELFDKVEQDFRSGIRSGVNRTPSFYINGKKYEGDWEGNTLLKYLKSISPGYYRELAKQHIL
jgi:protein-disulfide isomerase